jgi:uncharacterized protein YjlB
VLIYIKAIAVQGNDPAALFENTFSANGCPPQWRYGVYDFQHNHTDGHEVLGIASGYARLMHGGPDGRVLEVNSGDILLLPAGTGHCNVDCSDDFLVSVLTHPVRTATFVAKRRVRSNWQSLPNCRFPTKTRCRAYMARYDGIGSARVKKKNLGGYRLCPGET